MKIIEGNKYAPAKNLPLSFLALMTLLVAAY